MAQEGGQRPAPRHRRRRKAAATGVRPGDAGPERLQKLLAAAGFGSRRSCEQLLIDGRVTVNGETAGLGDRADPARDRIALDGEPLRLSAHRYLLVHKPAGMLTTLSDPEGRRTVRELLPPNTARVFPVGRLDADTTGLLLLTNDGALAHRLLHPSMGNEREYHVVAKGELREGERRRLERGVVLEDGRTAPARIERLRFDPATGRSTLTLVLTEGRKRQIRRSLALLGHPVVQLVRVRMGPLRLGSLPVGAVRELSGEEVARLREHVRSLRPRSRQEARSKKGSSSSKAAHRPRQKPRP